MHTRYEGGGISYNGSLLSLNKWTSYKNICGGKLWGITLFLAQNLILDRPYKHKIYCMKESFSLCT
jgi:hypothetical protein